MSPEPEKQPRANYLQEISLPGFNGLPISEVGRFFFRGLQKGSLNLRASAIAFNFLLALGPAVIFLLTLIPYLPIPDFKDELLKMFLDFMPRPAYSFFESTINELFVKRGGLQIFGFLTAIFFATKGVGALIGAFNASYHTFDNRGLVQTTIISLALVVIFSMLIVVSISLLATGKYLTTHFLGNHQIVKPILMLGQWTVVFALVFFAISFLYYLAPHRKPIWRFVSPGSLLASFLTVITALGFSFFVNHFAQFNKLFGSIGALIALMIWLNFMALAILIGFELNVSIHTARRKTQPDI